jgi:hypothetical protein
LSGRQKCLEKRNCILNTQLQTTLNKLDGLNLHTTSFIKARLNLCPDQPNGYELLKGLKIPYLQMDIPSFNSEMMLNEAMSLEPVAVPHREDNSQGWKSLCLHGLGSQKTMSCDRYGYIHETETPYAWTEVCQNAPETTQYLKNLLDIGMFSEFYRVRYMYLEPNGYIQYHQDRPDGHNSLGPLNIALNMPNKCYWLFEKWGSVPFVPGTGFAVDISNQHGVWNLSNQTRVHIIIHGRYGKEYYKTLERSALKEKQRHVLVKSVAPTATQPSTVPASNKFDCLLWLQNFEIKNSSLLKICSHLTEHFIRLKANKYIRIDKGLSLTNMLEEVYKSGTKWALVLTPGTIIKDGFYNEIKNLLNSADDNTFMYAHLLDRKERWYGIHAQCFIINVHLWNLIGRPPLYADPIEGVDLVAPDRSENNVHDDYTPLYLKPSEKRIHIKPKILGWNWIDKALKAGFSIYNFNNDVRLKKCFLYPEQNEEFLHNRLKSYNSPLNELIDNFPLSEHQEDVFSHLHMETYGLDKKMFIFNTEGVRNTYVEYNMHKIDAFIGLPAGFMDFHTLFRHKFNSNCKVIYFDINPATLAIKKEMYQSWNGENFPTFINDLIEHKPELFKEKLLTVDKEDFDHRWRQELEIWMGEHNFTNLFNDVKKLEKTYIQTNILENFDPILDSLKQFKNKHIAIWYSNCFNYTPGLASLGWDLNRMQDIGISFLNAIYRNAEKNNNKISIYGEDVVEGKKLNSFNQNIHSLFC